MTCPAKSFSRRAFLAGSTVALLIARHTRAEEQGCWTTFGACMLPGPEDTFDSVAVKDPSIVYFEGRWHVFYTARGNNRYTLGYTSAESIEGLGTAPRHKLDALCDSQHYAAAPQVFFFTPQERWYLIYQTRDSNYLPVFSTNSDISNTAGWSPYEPLLGKKDRAKWIDFWVLCDNTHAFCYYTRDHKTVCARRTALADFPRGWEEAVEVYGPVHEAVHVYRWDDNEEPGPYFMVCEQRDVRERRYFSLATAATPLGPFTEVDPAFATGSQLHQPGATAP